MPNQGDCGGDAKVLSRKEKKEKKNEKKYKKHTKKQQDWCRTMVIVGVMPRSCQGKKKEEKKNEKNYKKTHIFEI